MERNRILLLMVTNNEPENAIAAILSALNTAKADDLDFRIGQEEGDRNAFHLAFRRDHLMIQYTYTSGASFTDWIRLLCGGFLLTHKYIGVMTHASRFSRRGWDKQLLQSNDETVVVDGVPFVRHDVLAARGAPALIATCPLTIEEAKS